VDCWGESCTLDGPATVPPATDLRPSWQITIPIGRTAPHVYTECSGIWNPIHTERAFALASGLPDIVLHGTHTLALATRELIAHEANHERARLTRLIARFGAMVIPGDHIELRRLGDTSTGDYRVIGFEVHNAAGDRAIRDGVAVFRR